MHQKFNNLQKLYHITIKWDQKLDTPRGFSNRSYRSALGFFSFTYLSYCRQLVHNFTDNKGGSQTKAQIRDDPVITKVVPPIVPVV